MSYDVGDFFLKLMRVNLKKNTTNLKPTIHIIHILDRSESMSGPKLRSALRGINEEVSNFKNDDTVNYVFSLVDFGNDVHKYYWKTPINEVSDNISIWSQGCTALYQAIGETLSDYSTDEPVLVKIFTDGEQYANNWGKYNTAKKAKEVIQSKESTNFTITFVGTESDVTKCQDLFGIAEGNTLVHDNTGEGVQKVFKKSLNATKNYSKGIVSGEFTKTMSFYE